MNGNIHTEIAFTASQQQSTDMLLFWRRKLKEKVTFNVLTSMTSGQ